jgi:hypothetical protein
MARGEDAVVHWWGGLGRAGTVAASCLVARGVPATDAIRIVRAARPGATGRDPERRAGGVRAELPRARRGSAVTPSLRELWSHPDPRVRSALALGRAIGESRSYAVFGSRHFDPDREDDLAKLSSVEHGVLGRGAGRSRLDARWSSRSTGAILLERLLVVGGLDDRTLRRVVLELGAHPVLLASKGELALVTPDASRCVGRATPGRLAEAYAATATRAWRFEGFDYPPQSFIEMTAWSAMGRP